MVRAALLNIVTKTSAFGDISGVQTSPTLIAAVVSVIMVRVTCKAIACRINLAAGKSA
jgi:hypothetical protein